MQNKQKSSENRLTNCLNAEKSISFLFSFGKIEFMELTFSDASRFYWFIGQNIACGLLLIFCIILIWNSKKSESQSQKEMFLGFGLFALSASVAQILYLIQLYMKHSGQSDFLVRVMKLGGTGYEYILLLCFAIGFYFLLQPMEKYIMNRPTKTFSKIALISFILLLIPYLIALITYSGEINEIYSILAYPGIVLFGFVAIISVFGTVFIYLIIGKKSTGSIKKKGYFIGIGLFLMYFALIIGSEISSKIGGWMAAIFNPGVMIVGCILVISGQKIQ